MLVPKSWLEEYVDLEGVSMQTLSDRLTLGGLEVSGLDEIGETWDRDLIRVAQVLSVRPHPEADRLVLVTLAYGADAPMEVVTGAPNLHVGEQGQKVVFAQVGASLIDAYADTLKYKTLKMSKIRGVPSAGMVCSEKELGISDEHTGIIILPDDAPVGTPFRDYWGDSVFDLDLTPNLARAFCMTGVAREASALLDKRLKWPNPQAKAEGASIDGKIDIRIEDPELCPRYSAALVTGVKIGPSPVWMQRRLILAGMRPISNIVDITNYVMLEWGQPLHAFDYHRVRPVEDGGAPTIIVRRAGVGEKMPTLDGIERTFTNEMLLITDGGGPVAVAGVMGGLESEIGDDTVDVLIESANFNNINVRRTSAALKIPSEAAQRFGKGVDPELTTIALNRAAELMRELAGGTVAQGFADVYPGKPAPKIIDLQVSETQRLLGITLLPSQVADMLSRLGFGCEVTDTDAGVVRVTVPSFRLDVSIPADLIEEVARMYGYDRLPVTLIADELPAPANNLDLSLEEQTRDILVGCGLNEIITYSLTNLESVAKLMPEATLPDPNGYLKLANPLTHEQEYMRKTLANTTLETVASNLRFVDRVAVFEIAHVYLPDADSQFPEEPRYLSLGLSGPRESRSWLANESSLFDFYDLKGILETLMQHLGIQGATFEAASHPALQPGRVAVLRVGDSELGVLGEVHPQVRDHFGLPEQCVCLAELNLERLLALANPTQQFVSISRMPALKQDLALVVDETVSASVVEALIRQTGGALLVDVVLFDVYRGEQLGQGKKSLAYSLTFQAPNKTLTSKDAAKQCDRITRRLQNEVGASVRS